MDIAIRTEGVTQATAHLSRLEERLGNFGDVWPKVRDTVIAYQAEYLESRGFGTFAPLKPSTLKRKNRRSDRPFDTNSHQMWDSLIGAGPDFYYHADAHRMEIGVKTGPAHWHMLKRKHMPARPVIRMTPKLRRLVTADIRDYLRGGLMVTVRGY